MLWGTLFLFSQSHTKRQDGVLTNVVSMAFKPTLADFYADFPEGCPQINRSRPWILAQTTSQIRDLERIDW
jgi:hypothetical protein